MDLFELQVPETRLSDGFRVVLRSRGFAPGRKVLNRTYADFVDVDGNFVEQFQTAGFDSRTWELYLFAYLRDVGFEVERPVEGVDFIATRNGVTVAVEATTANPSADPSRDAGWEAEPSNAELLQEVQHAIPIRLGSALFSKFQRRYWERPDVKGLPLILAIESFAGAESLHFSSTGLVSYLYGVWHDGHHDSEGTLVITPREVSTHVLGEKTIPSGFFFQDDAEHISAIAFSNAGTVSKFNRIGYQEGLCAAGLVMTRNGYRLSLDPNAAEPTWFEYRVGDRQESWGEGLTIVHNPRALIPVEESLLPNAAHLRLRDDKQIVITCSEFHPFMSRTYTEVLRRP